MMGRTSLKHRHNRCNGSVLRAPTAKTALVRYSCQKHVRDKWAARTVSTPVGYVIKVLEVVLLVLCDQAGVAGRWGQDGALPGELLVEIADVFRMALGGDKSDEE